MKLAILRGSSEIGGSCVKITSGESSIIIDMGLPLYDKNGKRFDKKQAATVLPDVPGLYTKPYVDAILISHAHEDHYGLVYYSSKEIPIYAGRGTRMLMGISGILYGNKIPDSRFYEIKDREPFKIGPFEITPHIVDHSAYESMSFLISAEGKNVFYSGDFRTYGPRKWIFEEFIKEYKTKTDALLLEGTMIGGKGRDFDSEDEVLDRLTEELSKPYDRLTFAAYSSQNIGRFVSMYKACLKTKKTLVIDPYGAYILDTISKTNKKIPSPLANNLKIYCVSNRVSGEIFKIPGTKKYGRNKIALANILANPGKYVITDRFSVRRIFRKYLNKPRIIWSLWSGCLEENRKFWDECGDEIIQIHSSGHADIDTLKRLVEVIKPEAIIPIHTQNPCLYASVFQKSRIMPCPDGEEIEI